MLKTRAMVEWEYEPQLGRTAEQAIGAVSYTHLRAHETVLDIVCRLLLVNKKHAIQSRISLIRH